MRDMIRKELVKRIIPNYVIMPKCCVAKKQGISQKKYKRAYAYDPSERFNEDGSKNKGVLDGGWSCFLRRDIRFDHRVDILLLTPRRLQGFHGFDACGFYSGIEPAD
jgi:hypothetical protein